MRFKRNTSSYKVSSFRTIPNRKRGSIPMSENKFHAWGQCQALPISICTCMIMYVYMNIIYIIYASYIPVIICVELCGHILWRFGSKSGKQFATAAIVIIWIIIFQQPESLRLVKKVSPSQLENPSKLQVNGKPCFFFSGFPKNVRWKFSEKNDLKKRSPNVAPWASTRQRRSLESFHWNRWQLWQTCFLSQGPYEHQAFLRVRPKKEKARAF